MIEIKTVGELIELLKIHGDQCKVQIVNAKGQPVEAYLGITFPIGVRLQEQLVQVGEAVE